MTRLFVASAFAVLAFGGTAFAQVPASDRTLVTDPAVLVAMGFPANAQNVYLHNSILAGVVPADTGAQDFGLGNHYTPVPAKSFIGRQNVAGSWQYGEGDPLFPVPFTLSRLGAEPSADAIIQLPAGVNIAAIRYWAYDDNGAANLGLFVLEVCAPGFSGGADTVTVLGVGGTTGSAGYQGGVFTGAGGVTVNNLECNYVARLSFGATTGLMFQKLRVQWNRQVSPSPAFATFNDVPVGHPFHPFVEALANAGITGGCAPGLYCPESPVTRGQMAVFLSVALGLYWQ